MRAVSTLSALILITPIALAETAPASTDAVYACAALESDTERLACYDTAVGRLKAAEEAGEVTTVSRAEVEEVQKEAFGFSLPSLPKLAMPKFGGSDEDGELQTVSYPVASIKASKVNGVTVTLENGQVWQQAESRKVRYSKKRGVEEATIMRGAMGGYMMKLDGGVAFRVKRVK